MQLVDLPEDGKVRMYDYKEGARLIVDRALRSTKLVKGKKERKRTYYNVVMAFDIETTQLDNLNYDKERDPKQLAKFNITFCWQCSIEGCFIFGRNIEEFFEMLDTAAEELDSIVICYIHNIAYEYNNLCDYFLNGIEDRENDIFFKTRSTPLYFRYRKRFEFRCSKLLTSKGLAKVGKEIGYNKLVGDFDYNVQRDVNTVLTPMELNYCYRDVMILDKFLHKERDDYCRITKKKVCHICHLPFTKTGYVRQDVQKNFSYKPAGRHVLSQTELDEKKYDDISPALWGGYTHTNYRYIAIEVADPFHVDIKSAYPGSMLEEDGFPYCLMLSELNRLDTFLGNLHNKKRAVIAKVTFKNIKMKRGQVPYIPAGKCKMEGVKIVENGKVLYCDELTLVACDVDLNIIEQAYDFKWDDITLHYYYFGIKEPLPYTVIMLVAKYFTGKSSLRDVLGMEAEYQLSKAQLNALYGMMCQALKHMKYEIRNGLAKEIGMEYEPAKTLPYQWAIYVTAYTRRLIYSMILIMQRNNTFIYSDTDSIFFKKDPEAIQAILEHNNNQIARLRVLQKLHYNLIPKNPKGKEQYLFTLDFEDCTPEKSEILNFCSIGAKRYYQQRAPGLYDVTFSGLRATKIEKDEETGERWNGTNTQWLIDEYGTLHNAFMEIKKGTVSIPYKEGVDKLSNFNIRSNFVGELNGIRYERPCTYTLYPQSITLSLNHDLRAFLESPEVDDYD